MNMPMTIATPQGLDDEACWASVCARERAANGRFVFAVATTGIYCRPSCPARRPKRENVRFFVDGARAREAGFRACKRCVPDEASREERAVLAAIAAIRSAGQPLALAALAAEAGYSPAHFQRVFAAATGLSPAGYARTLQRERAGQALSEEGQVTEAIYAAGFSGPSRFYEATRDRLGMAASAWANGGRGVTIAWAVVATTLGELLVAATAKGVCRVAFGEGEAELRARFAQAELVAGGAEFAGLLARVVAAVEVPGNGAGIPLDVRGTAFQEAVWRALQAIPAGETRSYAQIAAAVGKPGAVRAAGSANGANPVAVLIPCHRVIRSDGSPGGYAWGLERKAALLARERSTKGGAGSTGGD